MSTRILTAETDFFLEELDEQKHLDDFHEWWSDPRSLIWSTQSPKESKEQSKEWLRLWTKATDGRIYNYAIMLRPESPLNPTGEAYEPLSDSQTSEGGTTALSEKSKIPGPPRPYLAGMVGILKPAPVEQLADSDRLVGREIGYGLHHPFWGKGLAKRALRLFLSLYFDELCHLPQLSAPNRATKPRAPEAPTEARLVQSDDVVPLEAHVDEENAASVAIVKKFGFSWSGLSEDDSFRLARDGKDAAPRHMKIWVLRNEDWHAANK